MSNVVIKPVTDGHFPKRLNTSKLPSLNRRRLWVLCTYKYMYIHHSKYDIHDLTSYDIQAVTQFYFEVDLTQDACREETDEATSTISRISFRLLLNKTQSFWSIPSLLDDVTNQLLHSRLDHNSIFSSPSRSSRKTSLRSMSSSTGSCQSKVHVHFSRKILIYFHTECAHHIHTHVYFVVNSKMLI